MADPNTMHVTPINDLIEHDTSGDSDCVCGPRTRPVEKNGGGMGWVVVHNSLDGRERYEGGGPS
ncbi:hypothetical protein OG552_10485 [Streptomyces sp. NBC_01476]|uniref:hypothetical protein n=1 Tax=Streptomyces sp. NBC_01476 TaxID=2903881 RepID=UPI002E33EC18|nr:hypothetical protein [Streptomyces sp. NBC_01476]